MYTENAGTWVQNHVSFILGQDRMIEPLGYIKWRISLWISNLILFILLLLYLTIRNIIKIEIARFHTTWYPSIFVSAMSYSEVYPGLANTRINFQKRKSLVKSIHLQIFHSFFNGLSPTQQWLHHDLKRTVIKGTLKHNKSQYF